MTCAAKVSASDPSWQALKAQCRGRQLKDLILHNDIVPAVNQVETHLFHQQMLSETKRET